MATTSYRNGEWSYMPWNVFKCARLFSYSLRSRSECNFLILYRCKEAERPHATVQVRARESLIIVSYRLRSTWPFSKTLLRFCSFVTQVQGARRGERVFISRPARLEAEELTALCMPPGGQTTSISQRTTFLKTRGAARCVAAAAASARCAPRRCPYSTPTASIITRYCPS